MKATKRNNLKTFQPGADYMKWFARFPLRRITSKEQNEAALKVVRNMSARESLSPDALEYLNLLTEQIENFEKRSYSLGAKLSTTEHLKIMMKEHGLNQSGLAEKLGVTQSNIAHILGGRQRLTTEQIELLSRIFHVSPAIFFENVPVTTMDGARSVFETRAQWNTQIKELKEQARNLVQQIVALEEASCQSPLLKSGKKG
ncbi:MAG: helix-turn-helix transcriptional regulator [Cyanobacteria bacterium SZAS LIN-3]|nr:helix-turn-helix transcriptional regulator [Cyanobacteria bacterium SZAS LIN-3]